MGKCKAKSWDCPCGTSREVDREAVEGMELFHEPTGLLLNRQPFHSRDLFEKESFVKGEKNNNNNNASRIICSPTQKQGAGDGFSLCVQEIHKSPVLMRI